MYNIGPTRNDSFTTNENLVDTLKFNVIEKSGESFVQTIKSFKVNLLLTIF